MAALAVSVMCSGAAMNISKCPSCSSWITEESFKRGKRSWNLLDPIAIECDSCGAALRLTMLSIFLSWCMKIWFSGLLVY